MSASTPMPTTSSLSATLTAAGATASAEPLGCDIRGEVDLRGSPRMRAITNKVARIRDGFSVCQQLYTGTGKFDLQTEGVVHYGSRTGLGTVLSLCILNPAAAGYCPAAFLMTPI